MMYYLYGLITIPLVLMIVFIVGYSGAFKYRRAESYTCIRFGIGTLVIIRSERMATDMLHAGYKLHRTRHGAYGLKIMWWII